MSTKRRAKPSNRLAIGFATVAVAGVVAYFIYANFFWRLGVAPFIDFVTDRISDVTDEFGDVTVIVNYDEDGRLWLTGRSITDHTKFDAVISLKEALRVLEPKGRALVAQVYAVEETGSDSLFASAQPRNTELEERVWEALIANGFTRK